MCCMLINPCYSCGTTSCYLDIPNALLEFQRFKIEVTFLVKMGYKWIQRKLRLCNIGHDLRP
jgi:hypothetical protein